MTNYFKSISVVKNENNGYSGAVFGVTFAVSNDTDLLAFLATQSAYLTSQAITDIKNHFSIS